MTKEHEQTYLPATVASSVFRQVTDDSLMSFMQKQTKGPEHKRPWFSVNDTDLLARYEILRYKDMRIPILNPSRTHLVFLNRDKIQVWDIATLKLCSLFSVQNTPPDASNAKEIKTLNRVYDLAWLGDNHLIVAKTNGDIQLYTIDGHFLTSKSASDHILSTNKTDLINNVAVSPDLQYLAVTIFSSKEGNPSFCTILYDCRLFLEKQILRPIRQIRPSDDLYSLPIKIRFHPDGKSFIAFSGKFCAQNMISYQVEVYNLVSGSTSVLTSGKNTCYPPKISNFSKDGSYCVTTESKVLVINKHHKVSTSFEYDASIGIFPPVRISDDGKEIFVKPGKPGVDIYRIGSSTGLTRHAMSWGTFFLMPLGPSRALALIYEGVNKSAIVDTTNMIIIRKLEIPIQTVGTFAFDVSSDGIFFCGDNESTLRCFDSSLQLIRTIATGRDNVYCVRCNPLTDETAVVTYGDAVMTYQSQRDAGASTMPIYQGSSGNFKDMGSGTNFMRYRVNDQKNILWTHASDINFVDQNLVFCHFYNKCIKIYKIDSIMEDSTFIDEIVIDTNIAAMVLMHGFVLYLEKTKLTAVNPYDYQTAMKPDGKKEFVIDNANVRVVMANLNDAQDCCCAGKNQLALVTSETLQVITFSPEFEILNINTIPCKNGVAIRFDACKKRFYVNRKFCTSIYTQSLVHLADLYILSNGGYCVHVPVLPSDNGVRHPGYLWGKGDCCELFSVADQEGNEIVDLEAKRKVLGMYYDRSAVIKALTGAGSQTGYPDCRRDKNAFRGVLPTGLLGFKPQEYK